MVRIEDYNLSGYKNIKEANLKLNNINVIIGPNNSGKSNFMQSISFLNYLVNSSTDELMKNFAGGFSSSYFGELAPLIKVHESFSNKSEGAINFKLKISNSVSKRIFEYGLELTWISQNFEVKYSISAESLSVKSEGTPGKPSLIFDRKNDKVKFGAELSKTKLFESAPSFFSIVRLLKLIGGKNEEYADAASCLNSVIKAPIFYFSNTELLKPNSKDRVNEFNGRTVAYNLEEEIIDIEESGSKWEIFKMAAKNILNIEDIRVFRYGDQEETDSHKQSKVIKVLIFRHLSVSKSVNQLSDGSILILAIIAKILTSEDDVIFIEEPENSTHPKALIDLLAFFKSYSFDKQFIISSHSIALLNKTRVEDVITSCVNKDGSSDFFNITSKKELKNKLKQGYINFSDELFFHEDSEDEIPF